MQSRYILNQYKLCLNSPIERKYIAVCRDVFGNIIEMKFDSQQELTDFTMRPWMQVLFTFEREE